MNEDEKQEDRAREYAKQEVKLIKKKEKIQNTPHDNDSEESEEQHDSESTVQETGPKIMDFTFTPERIMSLMSRKLLKKMQIRWDQTEGEGLDYKEFCQLILRSIKTKNDDEKYELLYGSFKLFQEIDINDDKNMEWDEFTQYIVNAVTKSNIQGGEGMPSVREQLIALKAQKFKNFNQARKPLDKSNHFNVIQQALECKATNNVLCSERFGKEFKFYDKNMALQKKIAVPLTNGFISGIAYDDKNMIYACTTTDKKIYFYKQGKVKMEGPKVIDCQCIQTKIWYMPQQGYWLTAGNDFKIRHWSYEQCKFEQELDIKHTDEVTSCVEIQNQSYNCIATCSLDRTIKLFDVEHSQFLATIDEEHEKGIKKLRYQRENGGYMISIGNEVYANVWAPESMKSDMHQGRLVGHKKPINDGQFINKAPFFVTMDDINVIFIWDMKTLTAIQTFPGRLQSSINGLVITSNNCFWAYGKRFFQYDTMTGDDGAMDKGEDDGLSIDEESFPIAAYLNHYLFWQIVVKQKEIRMYDLINGKLISIYSEVFGEDNNDDITKFKIDKMHRKAYVTSNTGKVYVINCQNGVLLKKVTQYQENIEMMRDQGLLKTQESFVSLGSSNQESEQGQLNENWIYEDNQQISKLEKKKKARDARQSPEEPTALKKGQIEEFTYSDEDSDEGGVAQLYKTNKFDNPEINDLILVWEEYQNKEVIMMLCSNQKEFFIYDEQDPDPENTKLLRRVQGGHNEEITILGYNFHLSLVATGCINGEIALYDFEMSRLEGLLIGHTGDITALEFLEGYPLMISASMDNSVCIWGIRGCPKKYYNICVKRFQNISWNVISDVPATVTRLLIWKKKMKGIKKYRRHREKQLPAPTFRSFEQNFVFAFKDVETIWKEEIYPKLMTIEHKRTDPQKYEDVMKSDTYASLLADEKVDLFITAGSQDDYNDHIEEEFERIYLYIGDEYGFIKIWNLTKIIRDIGIDPCVGMRDGNKAFNPYRQEKIDCSEMANQIRLSGDIDEQIASLPMMIDPAMCGLMIRECKAHQDVITSLQKIELDDIEGIISCSKDNKVRNWNIGLDLLGNLNQKTDIDDPKWKFESNHKVEKQESEIQEIENIIDGIICMQAEAGEEEVFDYERRMLKVDYNRKKKVTIVNTQKRLNWLDIEEEKQKAINELEELQARQKRDREYEKARSNLITNKNDRTIAELKIICRQVQMTFPNKLPEGIMRELQNTLNQRQISLIEGDRKRIKSNHQEEKFKQSLTLAKKQTIKVLKHQGTTRNLYPEKNGSHSRIQEEENSIFNQNQSYPNSPKDQISKTKGFIAPIPKQICISLKKMIDEKKEKAEKIPISSQEDKNIIFDNQNIPKLRNKLDSLKKIDRFQVKESSPPPLKGKLDYDKKVEKSVNHRTIDKPSRNYKSQTQQDNNNINISLYNIRNQDNRPFSIADSEIQKVSDFGGNGLIKDQSTISLGTIYDASIPNLRSGEIDLSILKQRFASNQKNVNPLQPSVFHAQNQNSLSPSGQNSYLGNKRGSTFKKNQYMSVMNDGKRVLIDKKDFLTEMSNKKFISPTQTKEDLHVQMPRGSQDGYGVPKVISRNPVNMGTNFVTDQPIQRKEIFVYNELGKKPLEPASKMRSPSTRQYTISNDYSASNMNRITDHDRTEDIPTQDASPSFEIKRDQRIGSLPAIHNINKPSYSNFERIGESTHINGKDLKATQSMVLKPNYRINRQTSGMNRQTSQGSFSPRELLANQKFEELKEKYFGNKSQLIQERIKNKDRIQNQKSQMLTLQKSQKKSYKVKTIQMRQAQKPSPLEFDQGLDQLNPSPLQDAPSQIEELVLGVPEEQKKPITRFSK